MITLTLSGPLPPGIRSNLLQGVIEQVFVLSRRKSHGFVGLRFVSDGEMRTLNTVYRKRPRPTDVLSFSSRLLPGMVPLSEGKEWGDICIAARYAAKEAKRRAIPFSEEIVRLTAHGMLHLLGYDHVTVTQELKMFHLQERAVQHMCDTV